VRGSGCASLDILGNVIPAISGEEEKMESETQKILGTLERDAVSPHPMVVSATTTRVPVIDGHTESISIEFEQRPSLDDVRVALEGFRGRPGVELRARPRRSCIWKPRTVRSPVDVERGNA
jgi:aspartate-semialdehyde dehydrogenase